MNAAGCIYRQGRSGRSFGRPPGTPWRRKAVRRAGRAAQLKGIIHEIAIRETRNLSEEGLLFGVRTNVTRSPIARTVDWVTTRDGRVIARIQAKDCISNACVRKVQGRVAAGQYRTARLVGTRETADKLRSAGVTKRVHSS